MAKSLLIKRKALPKSLSRLKKKRKFSRSDLRKPLTHLSLNRIQLKVSKVARRRSKFQRNLNHRVQGKTRVMIWNYKCRTRKAKETPPNQFSHPRDHLWNPWKLNKRKVTCLLGRRIGIRRVRRSWWGVVLLKDSKQKKRKQNRSPSI